LQARGNPCYENKPKRNNKIVIRIPYNQDLTSKIKSIPRWDCKPKEKYWKVPYQ